MENTQSFPEMKGALEARISELDTERTSLITQIPALKEKLTTLRLEEKAKSLENEISTLHSEKALIEDEISRYSSGTSLPNISPSDSVEPTNEATPPSEDKSHEDSENTEESIPKVENQPF